MAKLTGAKKRAFLARMAKGRRKASGKKSTPKRKRRSVRKTIKHVRRRVSVARRKTRSRRSGMGGRKLIDKIPVLKNKTVQRIGFGLGMGRLATTGAQAIPIPIVQQNARIIGTAVAFATEPLAGVVDLALSGGLGQIGNLFNASGATGGGGGGAGFA